VLRLATSKRLLSHHPRLPPRMLRMWQVDSWGSKLPSRTKGLMWPHLTTQNPGDDIFLQQAYKKNTPTYPTTSSSALMQASDASLTPSPHQTDHPSMNTRLSSMRSCKLNSKRGGMWDLSPWKKLSPCWAPSTHHLSASYRNPGNRVNSGLSRTCPPHTLPWVPSLPSTVLSTQINTPAHGAPSLPSACSSGASPQARRQQYVTSRKLTETSPSSLNNGQGSSSAWMRMTASRLTHGTVLVWLQGAAYTAAWVMQGPKSCAPVASALFPNGWMTIFSFGSSASTLENKIATANNGHVVSQRTGGKSMTEAASGSRVKSCQMTSQRNSTRTFPAPSKISHKHQTGLSCLLAPA
jgi:hypothetical protein